MPKMKLASVSFFLWKLIFFLSFKFRFCRDCLSSCENLSGSSTCPVCRTSFNAHQKFNARDIEQQIYQSRGYCSGCNRRVTLYYATINVNLEGGRGRPGKGRGFELEAIFGVKCPTPGPSYLVKRDQIHYPSNWLEAKYVSLKGATYQLFKKAESIYFNKCH